MVLEDKIKEILLQIHKKISEKASLFEGIGVSSGTAGLSLYYYLHAKFHSDDNSAALGALYLNRSFEILDKGYLSANLYRELGELGSWLEIGSRFGFFEVHTNAALKPVDRLLVKQMRVEIKKENLNSIIGYGHYFINRSYSTKTAYKHLDELLLAIVNSAQHNNKGTFWFSAIKGEKEIYLGMSHGSAGILNLLIQASERSTKPIDRGIIEQGISYIKNNELTDKPVVYPIIVDELYQRQIYPNNWCYGDPSVAYVFLKSAIYLGDEMQTTYILNHLHHISARPYGQPYSETGLGLLYGTAGLAMLYFKMHELTHQEFLLNAYEDHIARLVAAFDKRDEHLGYKAYWNQGFATTNWAFSDGLIGIAVSLMGYVDKELQKVYAPFFNL